MRSIPRDPLGSMGAKVAVGTVGGTAMQDTLERAKGFEPSTPTLARLCSTPELHPHPHRQWPLSAALLCQMGERKATDSKGLVGLQGSKGNLMSWCSTVWRIGRPLARAEAV
jgi:hypothetical protein